VKIWAAGYSINKGPLSRANHKLLWVVFLLSLIGRGGEGGWGVAAVQGTLAWRRRGTSAAPESFFAPISGVLQRRAQAGGYLRPASAHHGRKATLLGLDSLVYLPPGFKPTRRIFSSCCCAPSSGAGPSGSSPVPVFLARRQSSGLDGDLEDPFAFYLFVLRTLL
jgi:hypothetical protein